MFTKLAIFGIGYLLGSRAGREAYERILTEAREVAASEEVASAVGLLRGLWWIISQRGREAATQVRQR